MTTGTAFALASISKTLTAAVVLQLVEEGKLSLDQRVAPLLPAFGLDKRMTVRQLLDHTSGLPDYFLNAKIDRPLQAAPTPPGLRRGRGSTSARSTRPRAVCGCTRTRTTCCSASSWSG